MVFSRPVWSVMILTLLLTLVPREAAAQESGGSAETVLVTVKQAGVRTPMPGALVTAESEVDGIAECWTGDDGKCRLEGLNPGEWTVYVDVSGFELKTSTFTVPLDGELTSYVRPTEDERQYRYQTSSGDQQDGTQTIDAAEIRSVPAANNDPLTALQALPGVARAALGFGLLVLQGGAPQDSNVYLDGVPIPRLGHLGGLRSVLPASQLKEVRLHSGTVPVRYGNVLAGVVELITHKPEPEQHHGRVAVEFVEAAAQVEGSESEFTYLAAARKSFIEAVWPAIEEVASVDDADPPSYWDYQVRAGWHPEPGTELSAHVMGAGNRARFTLISELGGTQTLEGATMFHQVMLRYATRFGNGHRNTLVYSVRPEERDVADDASEYFREAVVQTVRNQMDFAIDDVLSIQWGIEGTLDDYRLDVAAYLRAAEFEIQEDWYAGDAGTWLESVLELGDVTLVAGGRLDFSSVVQGLAGSLRTSARWQFVPSASVRLALGTYNQAPSPFEASFLDDVDWQRGWQGLLEFVFDVPGYAPLEARVAGFYRNAWNFIAPQIASPWLDIEGLVAQDGRQRAWGMELLIGHRFDGLFEGWVSYTLSRTEGRRTATYPYQDSPYDQPHNLQLVGVFSLPKRWRIGFRFGVVSGAPYSSGGRELFGSVIGQRFEEPVQVEPFHRLDLRVDKEWLFDLWRLSLYLDIQNVYLHRNVAVAGREIGGTVELSRGVPILPSLGVAAEY